MTTAMERQNLILTGEIVIEGRLIAASNATLLGRIADQITVIYKPIAGERPLWDFPDGDLASREVAAFQFSELAGFHLVPFTVMRDGPYGFGAVQEWIDVDESADIVSLTESDHPELRKMALFDAIINNTDRKFGHILIAPDGQIFGCDHGVTFHEEDKLRTVLWQCTGLPLSAIEIDQLEKIKSQLISWNLNTWLTETEIRALQARIDRLLTEGRFPTPSTEWPAVPWPPF
ncbi:MAG: SCO1664 family protein [Actinomycetes bacterium]